MPVVLVLLRDVGACLEVLCPGRALFWGQAWMNPRGAWLRALTPAAGQGAMGELPQHGAQEGDGSLLGMDGK